MLRLSLLAGMCMSSWRARAALRIRASMSEMGSLVMTGSGGFSPARLDHAGELPAQRELPEAHPAECKIAIESARAAANLAAVHGTRGKFRWTVRFGPLTGTRHD